MDERPEAQQGGHDPAAADAERVASDLDDLSRATSEQSTRPDIEAERDEYLELARRTKADFENYRKRVAGDTEAARQRGKSDLAAELVPVLDNLERALTAAGIEPAAALSAEAAQDGVLEQGVVLTYRELSATLARAGVEAFDPAGERFDPEWHEALSTRPDEGTEPGTVLDVMQKGYRLDGQLIRAARVVVSE